MGNIGVWQLLIILLVVVLIFGTKKLPEVGSNLAKSIRGFKKGLTEDERAAGKESSVEIEKTPLPTDKNAS